MMLSTVAGVLRRTRRPVPWNGQLPGSVLATPIAVAGEAAPHHCLVAKRSFYFPRKNWFPWRTRIIHARQKAERLKRHIWPRRHDPTEAPIFGDKEDGTQLTFIEKDIRIGQKKFNDYARLIRGRQIQDAHDWIESLVRMKSEPVLKMLRKAINEVTERHDWDISRTYIYEAVTYRGAFVKSIKKHARANYGIVKSPRSQFMFRVRQLPLEEFFHRLYINNKIPRSIAGDMRLALHQGRVSRQMQKEWAPYLCANSRLFHRKELKWLDSTRQFNYYEARAEWIQRYQANQARAVTEAREARGLPPLALATSE